MHEHEPELTTSARNPDGETRSLTTDAAVLLAPAVAVGVDHLLNRPPKDEPPKVELPPGVKKD